MVVTRICDVFILNRLCGREACADHVCGHVSSW
jgi:hypothetical protein